MIYIAHSSHIGVEGCVRRVRDTLYWPQVYKNTFPNVIFVSHIVVTWQRTDFTTGRLWAKIGVDLCELDGRILLAVSDVIDYYSNFIEIDNINRTTS